MTKKTLFSLVFGLGIFLGSFSLPATATASTFYATTYYPEYIGVDCVVLSGSVMGTDMTDAYRWFEYGPEGYSNSITTGGVLWDIRISGHGGFGPYRQIVKGLKPNTAYSYHAVAATITTFTTTDRVQGYEVSFRTKVGTPTSCESYVPGQPVTPNAGNGNENGNGTTNGGVTNANYRQITTQPATNITDTSARFNAVAIPLLNSTNYGWYEWGTTPELGNVTPRVVLSNTTVVSFSQEMIGLKPGTTYFFKPVMQNTLGTSEGLVYSFRTTGTAPSTFSTVTGTTVVHSNTTGTKVTVQKAKKTTTVAKMSTTTESSLASASLLKNKATGNSFFDWLKQVWLLLSMLFLWLLLFFLFLFFGRKKDQEEETQPVLVPVVAERSEIKIPQKPVVMPLYVNKKGEAPDNLPL